jgi:hypothetical protein
MRFEGAILVFDHLDLADFAITPGERFPATKIPVTVFPLVWDAMRAVLFFASSHVDERLLSTSSRRRGHGR